MDAMGFGSLLAAYVGVVAVTVGLPFIASFLLDGIVQVLRGRGLKLFLAAVAMTVALAVGGYAPWIYGTSNPPMTSAALAGMGSVVQFLLPYSTALALLAFVIRMAMLLWKGR